jgi:hypothetical protein
MNVTEAIVTSTVSDLTMNAINQVSKPAVVSIVNTVIDAAEDDSATAINREIGTYDEVKTPGLETHHLIPERFNPQLEEAGLNPNEGPCTPLEHEYHVPYTNAWQDQIPYKNSSSILRTDSATLSDIWNAAQNVYSNDPDYLDAVYQYLQNGQY